MPEEAAPRLRSGLTVPDRARASSWLADILEIFTGLEADGAAGRNAHFLAGPWVTPDASLARLHLKYPEAAQLDPFAPLHGQPHRIEHRVDSHLSLHLGDVGDLRNLVDDVDLDHA